MDSITVGARPTQPGTHALLAGMGQNNADSITKNGQLMKALESFMGAGTGHQNASQRIRHTEYLVNKLTNIKQIAQQQVAMGRSKAEAAQWYRDAIQQIAEGSRSNELQMSSFGRSAFSQNPADMEFSGFEEPSFEDEWLAKRQMANYITSNAVNPSPEFAQAMQMAAAVPIAKEMIPNTVWLKAMMTDSCIGQVSKIYQLKKRYKAFQQGLTSQVAGLPPSEIQEYDPVIVTPEDYERPVTIDMKYIETNDFDTAADMLSDGGREMQVLIDQTAFKGLDFAVPPGGAAPAAGSTTNQFRLDNQGTVMTLEDKQNPQVEHINFANQILRDRGYSPDLIIISPFELGVLMSQQAILMAYAFGTREVMETGLVGTLLGNAVAWTPNLFLNGSPSSYSFWVVDSDELARTVLGLPITLYPNFSRRKLEYLLYTRLQIFIRNSNACIRIVANNTTPGLS